MEKQGEWKDGSKSVSWANIQGRLTGVPKSSGGWGHS